MKKNLKNFAKKALVATLAFTTVFSAAACGGGGGGESSNGGSQPDGVTNPYTLTLYNYSGGFGTEWSDLLIERYKKERAGKKFVINGVTYDGVDFEVDYTKTGISGLVTSGIKFDIWFHEFVNYYQFYNNGFFAPMTEVFTTENPYEPGTKLEDKLTEEQKAFYKIDTDGDGVKDTYYAIPHYAAYHGLTYNRKMFTERGWFFKKGYKEEDLLDELKFFTCFTSDLNNLSAGPDGLEGTMDDGLPVTYDDFYALCRRIAATNKPVAWFGMGRRQYVNWYTRAMLASNEGPEQMRLNFSYNGTATNLVDVADDGTVTPLGDVEITPENGYMLAKQEGRYQALSFLNEIISNNWYSSSSYDNTEHMTDAQEDFVMGKTDAKETAAMLLEGCWWLNESDSVFDMIDQMTGVDERDNFAWMPFPSPTKEAAEERKAAFARGENGYTLLESHNCVGFLGSSIDEEEKPLAIDFLQFAYTDKSLAEYTLTTNTTRAVKYTLNETDKAKLTGFAKSLIDIQERAEIVSTFSDESFFLQNEVSINDTDNTFTAILSSGTATTMVDSFRAGVTVAEYFKGLYNYDKNRWDNGQVVI